MAEELIAGVWSSGWWCNPISGSGFEGGGATTASCLALVGLDMLDFIEPRSYYEPPPALAFQDILDFSHVSAPVTETWGQADLIGSPALIQAQQDSSLIDPLMKGERQIFSVETGTSQLYQEGLSELNNCSSTESPKSSASLTKEAPSSTFNTNSIDGSSRCSNQGVKKPNKGAEKKNESEPKLKKPRIETPTQLPTFKVRKEKLGDRITALQQLVSPFGKTDTASVLHEAIDYIKFLHDQVRVLSSPHLKKVYQNQHMQEQEEEDLSSRGLCLVPVSDTFAVAKSENPLDFWAPFLGGTFR